LKVLLIGGGGREHALAWALARSGELERLDCAPGNAGIRACANCLDIAAEDVDALTTHAIEQHYDLVVVGPEAPLVAGLADRLRQAGIPVFGPSAAAAQLEGSKIFSKLFMQRHEIPTAAFEVFTDFAEARAHLANPATTYPLVVKADGLAAGKGVILAADAATAIDAARGMLSGADFGEAGRRILVEEHLYGREASFFVLADGENFVELATCQDYKRVGDGDSGLNTGGMGTYSPSVYLNDDLRETILEKIVRPSIRGLASERLPYRGVLFIGLMLTDDGPKVLEYNVRFGDPETQVLIPRLDGDWLALLRACAEGKLDAGSVRWNPRAAVCVVMAAEGYPAGYEKGRPISGLDSDDEDVVVFHAGTKRDPAGQVVTSGGRVLGVAALGDDLASARERAYAAVKKIEWRGEHHRDDIALDALQGDSR